RSDRSPLPDERAIGREFFDPMNRRVREVHDAPGPDRDAGRAADLSRGLAGHTPRSGEPGSGMESIHLSDGDRAVSMVQLTVDRNQRITGRVGGDPQGIEAALAEV